MQYDPRSYMDVPIGVSLIPLALAILAFFILWDNERKLAKKIRLIAKGRRECVVVDDVWKPAPEQNFKLTYASGLTSCSSAI